MPNLVPLGYVNIDHVVRWIVWAKYKEEDEEEDDELKTKKVSSHKTKDKVETAEEVILIGCEGSCLIGITVPDQSSLGDDRLSFLIEDACSQLYTIESMRLYYELAYPKEEIIEEEITEEAAELEGEETEELVASEIVLPEIEELPREPPEVLFCYPSNNSGHIWLSLGEDDTGFLFEYPLTKDPESHPVNLIPVRAVELCAAEKQSVLSICVSPCGEFVFMGQADGALSVYSLEDKFDLCSIVEYWKYGFHDSQLGPIRFTHISPDGKLIATVGDDCNIFLYKFKPPRDRKRVEITLSDILPHLDRAREAVDIKGEDTLSIEEAYQKSKEVEHLKKMKEKRELISKDIENLIEELNIFKQEINILPSSLQLNIQEIIMHSRIKADLIKRFESKVQKVHNEMAWKLEWHSLALKKLCDRFKKFILQERTVIKSYFSGEEVYGFRVHTLPVELAYDTEQEAASEEKKPEEIIEEEDKGAVTEVKSMATSVFTASSAWEEVQWPPEMIMTKAQFKYLERKKEKLERDKEWAELNACKPESECSPEEDEVIKHAKQTLGDFKLKTDSDYVVPAHLRLNATQKRDQILDFYRRIHSRKKDFNNKIYVLEETWKRLNNLKSEMEKGNGKVLFQDANQDVVSDSKRIESKLKEKNILRQKNDNIEKAKEITRKLAFFDAELHLLRIIQCKYCTEIKYADCRYVNMIQELGILKRSDEEERTLENNIALKKQELNTLNQKMENADIVIAESQRLIEIKKTEGYENYKSFLKELGEGHKYANFLTRLFKKKIRQVRRERDEEEEESESEESNSDDDYSSDEETPGKIITETDIEPILLNAVTKHREIRQQIDDVIKKEQNQIEIMKKEKDMTKKKIRNVDTSLFLAHAEMEKFQVKKQSELNKLKLVVILHFNQIMELNISKLPGLLNELLVFSDPVLKALNTRVHELRKESTYLKQQQREIIHQHHQLNMAGHILENSVTRLKEICHAEKMQKFGQDVDLDFLDDLENNPHAAVLRFKKEQLHNNQEKEIQLLNNNIESKKVEVAEITKHNSRLTNLLVKLKKEKNALNKQLGRRRKQFV